MTIISDISIKTSSLAVIQANIAVPKLIPDSNSNSQQYEWERLKASD